MNTIKKKKILIINYEFPPLGGGGGVAAKELAKGFIQNGYEVDYLTSGYRNLISSEVCDGIRVYRVKSFSRKELATATFISMLSFLFFGFFKGLGLCRKNNYAFINTHFVIPTGPLGWIFSRIFKVKNLLSIHGGDIYDPSLQRSPHKHWYWRIIIRFIMNRSDFIIAQSSNTKENAEKYYSPQKKIDIIPLPYSKFSFSQKTKKELNLNGDKKYLVSVGRLVKRKGYSYLLRAFAGIKRDNLELLIIGNGGPEETVLKSLISDLGISQKVHFLNKVDTSEEKFQYLNIADIYILSSLHEGFGIVLQEAMQVGLPVIATNYGGQVDLIKDGENGLLIDPKNIDQLRESIVNLLEDENLMIKMKKNNTKAIKDFDSKIIAFKYLNFLNE